MKAALCGALVLLAACASSLPDGPRIWVNVRSIELVGIDERDRAPVLALSLALSPLEGGLVEKRKGLPVVRLTIADLGSGAERRLESSAIQVLVETVAMHYARQERLGVRVDVRRGDFERMLQGDTRLRLHIRDAATLAGT